MQPASHELIPYGSQLPLSSTQIHEHVPTHPGGAVDVVLVVLLVVELVVVELVVVDDELVVVVEPPSSWQNV